MSALTPELVAEINRPPDQRSSKFRSYVAEKIALEEALVPQMSVAAEQEEHFLGQIERFDLREEDLRNKRILDLGCGREGYFVREVLKRNLTEEIYGLDINIRRWRLESVMRAHLIRGTYDNSFPLSDFDYIVSHASASLAIYVSLIQTKRIILHALDALRSGGQIRLYPVDQPSPFTLWKEIKQGYERWVYLLGSLSRQTGIRYELRPVDIYIAPCDKGDVYLQHVVIIHKP